MRISRPQPQEAQSQGNQPQGAQPQVAQPQVAQPQGAQPQVAQPYVQDEMNFDEVLARFVNSIDRPEVHVQPLPEINQAVKFVPMPFSWEEVQHLAMLRDQRKSAIFAVSGLTEDLDIWMTSVWNQGIEGSIFQLVHYELRDKLITTWFTFINQLQFFQQFSDVDQFILLNSNMSLLSFVIATEVCNPKLNGVEQLKTIFDGVLNEDIEFPILQASHYIPLPQDHPGFQAISCMQNLNLDKSAYYLVMLITIFALNSSLSEDGYRRVIEIQEHVRIMLYRYLCTKINPTKARMSVELVEIVINLFITYKDSLLNAFSNPPQ